MEITVNIEIASIRKKLASYTISCRSFEALVLSIKEKLFAVGLEDVDENKFLNKDGTKIDKYNYTDSVFDNNLFVLYDNIVTPYGAYEYDRVDGLIFFFHFAEKSHKKYPHIHVKCSGEEISIYLFTNKVIGNFSNRKMLKKAIDYIKKNKNKLISEWNKIIK